MSKKSCTPCPRFEADCYNWNDRYNLCCEQAKNKAADIIFIGDSITHFWDSKAIPNSHGGPVWDKYFSDKNVLNIGFGWDRTANVLWRLEHGHFAGQHPKLVVLNIGTNNFAKTENYPGDTPADVADGITAVLAALHKLSPETHIIVMAVFPRGNSNEELQIKVAELNQILGTVLAGRPGITFLNLTDKFMNPDGTQKKALFLDGCHLNHEGYEIWANALLPLIHKFADKV